MAVTQNTYTGNGSTVLYSFTFPYLEESDIKVQVNGSLTTAYTFANATTIQFNVAPANGAAIRIYRDTDTESLKATFFPGSAIRAQDLNENFNQTLYSNQEVLTELNTKWNKEADTISSTETWVSNDSLIATTAAVDSRVDSKIDTALTTDVVAGAGITVTDNLPASGQITVSITDSGVTTSKINDAAVTADKLATNSVTTAKISDANITTAKIADSNVTTAKVQDSAITTSKVADSAITTGKIADSAVTDAKVASNISGSKITDGTLTSSKLSDATIITNAEQIAASVNDTSFFTSSAADARYLRQDSSETINSGMAWSSSDSFVATTKAIDARIIDLVDDVGGFVPIANETSFPLDNPDINNPDGAGTIVSIKEMNVTRTPVAGTVTISNGAGSNTVTITGCGSTVLAQGFGVLVETTSTLHTYVFHRLVPKATEVTTVASISSNVTTVAGISSNVTTVAGISGNVTTVASNISDIQTVAADLNEPVSEIDTVATNIANVNAVGNNISSVNTVAGNDANVTAVASNATNINAVAGNSSNINAVAANSTNINAVAGNNTNVTTVAGSIANVNTAAGSISSVNTVAGSIGSVNTAATFIANINTVASNNANINTVASNASSVYTVAGFIGNVNNVSANLAAINTAAGYLNAFQGLYLGVLASDPSVDSLGNPINAGDFYFNSTLEQTRIYNGVAWISIADNSFVLTGVPNASFAAFYTAPVGSNVINLGNITDAGPFLDEKSAVTRVSLATGSGTYNLGNL